MPTCPSYTPSFIYIKIEKNIGVEWDSGQSEKLSEIAGDLAGMVWKTPLKTVKFSKNQSQSPPLQAIIIFNK